MKYALVFLVVLAGCASDGSYLKKDFATGELVLTKPQYPRCSDVTLSKRDGYARACEVR